jgi:hypothetical protein
MIQYYVDFNNQLPNTWTMAVYQTLPDLVDLDSVSWKQTTVPPTNMGGVSWTTNYNVCIADYQQIRGIGVYTNSEILPAQLGTAWQVVWKDNIQQLVQVTAENVPPNFVVISNASNKLANLGIGMSGSATAFKRNVPGGVSVPFEVMPTYYVGLFYKLILGEVIESIVAIGPFELKFPNGTNKATLAAALDNSTVTVQISYSSELAYSLDDINRTRRLQELAHYAMPAPHACA